MEDAKSVATLLESTSSKIQQLQRAFAELESHRAVTLNLKWKQIEDHFHGLEKSLKRRFTELEDQEKEFEMKTTQSRQILEKRQAAVVAKEEASLERLQQKRDVAVAAIANVLNKRRNGITETETIVENKPPDDMERLSESDVKALSNPELAKLCEENDAQGLHKFISDNRKNISSIKEEIPIALKAAADPGGLVLDSLSGFYMSSSEDGKKDSNLLGEKFVSKVISKDVKERARVIADEWKPNLFVLLSGVIDVLVKNGRHIDAVNLTFAFELTEQFSPVSILKSYLTEARRVPSAIKSANLSPTAQNDVSERELCALKAVIKCIEDHKLEDVYPPAPLQKRILQLEKEKADKKRATEVAKPQPKRPRANVIAPRNTNIAADKNNNFYGRMTDNRYAPPTQYMYDNRTYGYPGPVETHIPQYMGTPAYNMAPNHGHYFATGYQYQAPYLH
ncbi:hypothetical protein M8C21_022504 [Ambrosia artemisiifolia]|uniref:FRIGIDA-like protein n=1 Tax=Ambrosia artemisiifolia TaxID=4212 RepID=A0AAD5GPP4_AMBAR|nr:hypothetical protein M8C21_022504 [Ambrosia artemisiifolia]